MQVLHDIERILYTPEQIEHKVKELAASISEQFANRNPLFICILKGAFIFMAELVKNVNIPSEVDFMAVSSYGHSAQTSGVVNIVKDLSISVEGRDVIIVEDIIDTGLTLSYLIDVFRQRQAKSITLVTLFDKPSGRKVELKPHYTGYSLPDAFVVGYGLDYAEQYRNLPFLGILKPSVYQK